MGPKYKKYTIHENSILKIPTVQRLGLRQNTKCTQHFQNRHTSQKYKDEVLKRTLWTKCHSLRMQKCHKSANLQIYKSTNPRIHKSKDRVLENFVDKVSLKGADAKVHLDAADADVWARQMMIFWILDFGWNYGELCGQSVTQSCGCKSAAWCSWCRRVSASDDGWCWLCNRKIHRKKNTVFLKCISQMYFSALFLKCIFPSIRWCRVPVCNRGKINTKQRSDARPPFNDTSDAQVARMQMQKSENNFYTPVYQLKVMRIYTA